MVLKPWQKLGLPRPKSEASTGPLSLVDYEVYSGIEIPKTVFVVRLDGWAFHGLARRLKLAKPFDKRLAAALAKSAAGLFEMFNPALAYIFSDEVNFLFLKPAFFRRIEKIDSIFAGYLSTAFMQSFKAKQPLAFDCRCIPIGRANIKKYFVWRQAECFRNAVNAYAQFALMKTGLSARAASKRLSGIKAKELIALCKTCGINFGRAPVWHRNGIVVRWQAYQKRGYDPVRKKKVVVARRKPVIDWSPPLFKTKDWLKAYGLV